jgi:hypothetical protein
MDAISEIVMDLRRRLEDMKTVRDRISPQWQEIRDYVFPDRGFFPHLGEQKDDGVKRRRLLINSTSAQASRTLAAGLQGGLTSPSRPWFALGVADMELREVVGVRTWLSDVRDLMLRIFAGSNFYESLHAAYEELGAFGTGGIVMESDQDKVLRCRSLTVGEYWCDADENGDIDTLFVKHTYTVRQLVAKFGLDALPAQIREQHKAKAYSVEYAVIHAILPREAADPKRRDANGMPWASLWFLESGDAGTALLRESGYRLKPFAVTRWKVCGGDVWGKSPGMDALGDSQMLQKMERDKLEALDKQVRPPIVAPTDMLNRGGVNIVAGGVTFLDTSRPGAAIAPLYQVDANLGNISVEIQRVEERIRAAFYSNLFLSIIAENKQMTAREVAERSQEKMMMLGPVIERFEQELLDPVIDRAFDILLDMGLLPEAPEELGGRDLRPEYISLLAQAQKAADVAALNETIMFAGNLAAASQSLAVLDKLDSDQAVDEYSRLVGAPVRVIRSDDDVAAMREQRAAAQAQAQQAAMLSQATADAKNLGAVKMDEDNAVTRLMQEANLG